VKAKQKSQDINEWKNGIGEEIFEAVDKNWPLQVGVSFELNFYRRSNNLYRSCHYLRGKVIDR
jgi:hypothetical protein